MSAAVECVHCGRPIVHDAVDGWVDPLATGDDVVWRETCDAHGSFIADHEPLFRSQSARDAQACGYGRPSYWTYLDHAAVEHHDYWLAHGDPVRAAEMMTQPLSGALRGNDGD